MQLTRHANYYWILNMVPSMPCYGARVNTTTDYRGEDNLVNDSFDDNHRTPSLALNIWDQELKKKEQPVHGNEE